jgi:hypothetical protein
MITKEALQFLADLITKKIIMLLLLRFWKK